MGYFWPNYQHPFWYCESLIHVFHCSTIISTKNSAFISRYIPNTDMGLGFEFILRVSVVRNKDDKARKSMHNKEKRFQIAYCCLVFYCLVLSYNYCFLDLALPLCFQLLCLSISVGLSFLSQFSRLARSSF